MNTHLQLSITGRQLLKQFEGLRLKAYQDSVGVWTIGYGHTKGVVRGMNHHRSAGQSVPQRRCPNPRAGHLSIHQRPAKSKSIRFAREFSLQSWSSYFA
ncbi:glycoside hydrolase family protein [Periweissella cryptocerci]|uniref:glycoside hydrolase family protein n=1 Tax=Periweissella cryptocerci TaxID=2506420 RepID=UPI0026D2F340